MPEVLVSGASRLSISGQVTLDAAGRGALELSVPASTVWMVQRIAISCTGPTDPMPSLYAYDGPENDANLLDATWTGTQDVSDFGTPLELYAGEFLTFVWVGGTAGTVGTARLIGRRALTS